MSLSDSDGELALASGGASAAWRAYRACCGEMSASSWKWRACTCKEKWRGRRKRSAALRSIDKLCDVWLRWHRPILFRRGGNHSRMAELCGMVRVVRLSTSSVGSDGDIGIM